MKVIENNKANRANDASWVLSSGRLAVGGGSGSGGGGGGPVDLWTYGWTYG